MNLIKLCLKVIFFLKFTCLLDTIKVKLKCLKYNASMHLVNFYLLYGLHEQPIFIYYTDRMNNTVLII